MNEQKLVLFGLLAYALSSIVWAEEQAPSDVASLPSPSDGKEWKLVWHDEFDDKLTWRTNAGGVSQVPAYIKLTVEIGDWAGDIKKAKLPEHFLVDYVRVYQEVEQTKQGTCSCAAPSRRAKGQIRGTTRVIVKIGDSPVSAPYRSLRLVQSPFSLGFIRRLGHHSAGSSSHSTFSPTWRP